MTSSRAGRELPPFAVWVVLGILAAVIFLYAVQYAEIRALRGQVESMRLEWQEASSTTAALEARLQNLEAFDPEQQIALLRSQIEAGGSPEQLAELTTTLSGVQMTVDGLGSALDNLYARIEYLESAKALEPGESPEPGEALPGEVRLEVVRQKQSRNLSCESSAAAMAAQYHGVALSEADVLAALPRNPNPNLGFRGNVDGPPGGLEDYGVYAGPIIQILEDWRLRARLVEGGLAGIKAALARGNPVVAWITYDCQLASPTRLTIGEEVVTLVGYQHAVVITGYNAEGVWANDPWDGQQDFYQIADLERAMGYFGDMAIEVGAP